MPLTATTDKKLYHGTSQKRLESILDNGFALGDPHYNNWLSPTGVYLVLGRPLIARRFALSPSAEDGSKPVVVSLKIKFPTDEKMWDLTTDEGMHLLYIGYTEIERKWKKRKRQNKSRAPSSYTTSKKMTIEALDGWLDEIFQNDFKVNRDSVVIRYIVELFDIELILASIQEGTTFNYSFSGNEPSYLISANYHGLSYRDHIEFCVLNPSLIVSKSIKIRDKQKDECFFEDGFGYAILDRRTPDAHG